MGGGDLNSKKSWHPNTIRNQERVWKAEQAAAEEKKRILELQRERAEESTREELNEMAKRSTGLTTSNDNRLHWMYDKPDKKAQQEDYLLGKAIESNYDQGEKVEQDIIPAVARRVVGSSMLTTAGDTQVDLARKIREDPLLLVKERERAARAALLNNPLQRRRLAEMLRKEQDQRKEDKEKKKSTKKDKELDDILVAKLNALRGEKSMDLVKLLESDDSSDSSSSEDEKSSKKKTEEKKKSKKSKKTKKKKKSSNSNSDLDSSHYSKKKKSKKNKEDRKHNISSHEVIRDQKSHSRKRKSDSDNSEDEVKRRKLISDKTKKTSSDMQNKSKYCRDSSDVMYKSINKRKISPEYHSRGRPDKEHNKQKKQGGLSEEEKAARLAAMAAAGKEREEERSRRITEQRVADATADKISHYPRVARSQAHSLPDSLESRIHSNRHYIQRDQRHMNEHFARR